MKYDVISLFSGIGGLDLGFEEAGFKIIFSDDFDKDTWETYSANFPKTQIDKRPIEQIGSSEIPSALGVIGGPPCQAWSEAGALRGLDDPRGRVMWEYLRVVREKRPLFFVMENVSGLLAKRFSEPFAAIVKELTSYGYNVNYKLLDASDYGIPQERQRVFIVGYHNRLGKRFEFPNPLNKKVDLKESIGWLPDSVPTNSVPSERCNYPNHEYYVGSFSPIYLSRNRFKPWNEQSYTIQAGCRHVPLWPGSSGMVKLSEDHWKINEGFYRRVSIREAALIQGFPRDFRLIYKNVNAGYKIIGNAVPPPLSKIVAAKVMEDLKASHLNFGDMSVEALTTH